MNTISNIDTNIMISAAYVLLIILIILALVVCVLYSIVVLFNVCARFYPSVHEYICNMCCRRRRRRDYFNYDFIE